MSNVYPLRPATTTQTLGARVGYGKPTPRQVVIEVANDNKPRVRLPVPANDNAAVRHTAVAVARMAKLGLRLHPWVRAASAALDVLDALQQTAKVDEIVYNLGGITGNTVDRLSYNPNVCVFENGMIKVRGVPNLYKTHNLMPTTIMHPATSAADYPPGTTSTIGFQVISGPSYANRTRGYWAVRIGDNANAFVNTNRYAHIWSYRLALSSSVPDRVPGVHSPARPAIRVRTDPHFTPLPWTSPLPVGRPAALPRAMPGLGNMPGREVGPRPGAAAPPTSTTRPPVQGKERKFAIAVGGIWAAGISFATEGLDIIQALFKSLPEWLQRKLWKDNGGFLNPYDKAVAVVKYFHLIEGDKLIFNFLDMQSEDSTYGKIGRHVARANANLIGGGGITLGDAL